MPDKPSIFSCSTINTELFTTQRLQLPKFFPFVSELKDSLFRRGSESSWERKFHGAKVPWNFRSRERKFQGTKVPGSESSMELSLPGTKVPGSESSTLWNFRSRERKFLGAKVPAFD